jgi:hypothetical protein
VAIGQDKAVAIRPGRIPGIVPQKVVPQHFSDICHTHGGARMATICLLDSVHTQDADGIGELCAGGRHQFLQNNRNGPKKGRHFGVSRAERQQIGRYLAQTRDFIIVTGITLVYQNILI